MRQSEINVNTFWKHVKSKYPDARFERWFDDGELHFYRTGKDEKADRNLSVCYRDEKAHIAIAVGDAWK